MDIGKQIKEWIRIEVENQINALIKKIESQNQCIDCSANDDTEINMTPENIKNFADKIKVVQLIESIRSLNKLELTDEILIDPVLIETKNVVDVGAFNAAIVSSCIDFMNAMEDIDDQYKIDSVDEELVDYYESVLEMYLDNNENEELDDRANDEK